MESNLQSNGSSGQNELSQRMTPGSTLDRPWVLPGSTLDRSWISHGSTLDCPGSILEQPWIDHEPVTNPLWSVRRTRKTHVFITFCAFPLPNFAFLRYPIFGHENVTAKLGNDETQNWVTEKAKLGNAISISKFRYPIWEIPILPNSGKNWVTTQFEKPLPKIWVATQFP